MTSAAAMSVGWSIRNVNSTVSPVLNAKSIVASGFCDEEPDELVALVGVPTAELVAVFAAGTPGEIRVVVVGLELPPHPAVRASEAEAKPSAATVLVRRMGTSEVWWYER